MGEKVVPLRGNGVAASVAAPDPDVIEQIEDLLARARAGEIVSFAAVLIDPAHSVATTWAKTDGHYHRMVSGMALLQFRFLCANSGYRPDDSKPGA